MGHGPLTTSEKNGEKGQDEHGMGWDGHMDRWIGDYEQGETLKHQFDLQYAKGKERVEWREIGRSHPTLAPFETLISFCFHTPTRTRTRTRTRTQSEQSRAEQGHSDRSIYHPGPVVDQHRKAQTQREPPSKGKNIRRKQQPRYITHHTNDITASDSSTCKELLMVDNFHIAWRG